MFQNFPDKKRYAKFREICKIGTTIKCADINAIPSRIDTNNPTFTPKQKAGIGRKMIEWRTNQFLLGPIPLGKALEMHATLHRFFAVPKPDGTWRGILDLSDDSHIFASLNDYVIDPWRTVEYIRTKEIVEKVLLISSLSDRAVMWVKDLVSGYYNVPMRRDQVAKLGFWFDGKIYFYQVLPMGLTSSPNIFTEFMFFAIWAVKKDDPDLYYVDIPIDKVEFLHFRQDSDIEFIADSNCFRIACIDYYVDDIFGLHYDPDIAAQQWFHSETVLSKMNLKTKMAKGRPPKQVQIFLGKEYDLLRQWVRLGEEKFQRYKTFLLHLLTLDRVQVPLLLSAIGKARHCATIYRCLSAFARGLEIFIYCRSKHLQKVPVIMCTAMKMQLEFLISALQKCRKFGVPFTYFTREVSSPDLVIYTDASLTVGIGAICSNGYFVQHKWSEFKLYREDLRDIVWKEMVAIYATLRGLSTLLGDKFMDLTIHVFTDNMGCKGMLSKMTAKIQRPDLQVLINGICEIFMDNRNLYWFDFVKGKDNIYADSLSRYFPNPLGSRAHEFPNKLNVLTELKRASALAASHHFNIKRKHLSFQDPDEQ